LALLAFDTDEKNDSPRHLLLKPRSVRALNPWLLYTFWIAGCCLLFWIPLRTLIGFALNSENASHILLIPIIVIWLLYLDRQRITHCGSFDFYAGLLSALPAVAISVIVMRNSNVSADLRLAGLILGLLLLLVAGFLVIFGRSSTRRVWFSLSLLAFAIPIPEFVLNPVIYCLQAGSAAVAGAVFDWTGTPVLREGFVFHLPGLSIEVAKECSGIRSSMALLILALLVAHFSFSKFWKKVLFVLAGLVMMLVKNGVRIATLTLLATYVDPSFLFGRLHHDGGVVFFLLGIVLLLPIYWLLRRGEALLQKPGSQTKAALTD
jgi:exosortase